MSFLLPTTTKQSSSGTSNTRFNKSGTSQTTGTSTGLTGGATSASSSGGTRTVAPTWVEDAIKGVTSQVTDLGGMDPSTFVPGQNYSHTAAQSLGSGLTGQPWNWDAAMDLTKGVAGAAAPRTSGVKAAGFMDAYANPYEQDVIDASLEDYDYQSGLDRAQADLNINLAGAFGGSGAAIERDLGNDSIRRGRAALTSGLRTDGFKTALGAAQADAGREQGARDLNAQLAGQHMDRTLGGASQLANLSAGMDANTRANMTAHTDMGEVLRRIAGEEAAAPLMLAEWQNGNLPSILSAFLGQDSTSQQTGQEVGLSLGQETGSEIFSESGTQDTTETSTGKSSKRDPAGDAAKAAQIAALFSDRRLKRDIVKLRERADGLGLYLYRYLWSPVLHIGVMAQEVLKVRPEAVVRHRSGFLMVDYGRL